MHPIPEKIKRELEKEPEVCARVTERQCAGRVTWEHVWIYKGKQIQEVWAIIKICWYHHLGAGLDKKKNQRISLSRASAWDLAQYPRKNWKQYQ